MKTRQAICALVGLMNRARWREGGYMTRGRGCHDLAGGTERYTLSRAHEIQLETEKGEVRGGSAG